MKTIHKHQTSLDYILSQGKEVFKGYKDAKIVKLNYIKETRTVQFWYEVDTEKEHKNMIIYVYGTGWENPTQQYEDYIDTIIDGNFVWHFYQIHNPINPKVDQDND